jgi:hypothetical protein
MTPAAAPLGTAPLVQRASGIVVPAHLASTPEEPAGGTPSAAVARDPDGRRRVVIDRQTRKAMLKAAKAFGVVDLALVLTCRTTRPVQRVVQDVKTLQNVLVTEVEPVPGACGEVMQREDEGGADPGFGCTCTRIHFVKGV